MANMIENMVHGLMRQAGLEPQHIMEAYQFVTGLRVELEQYKAGIPKVIQHYNTRLDAIDRKLDHIITAMAAMPADPLRPAMPPGITIAGESFAPNVNTQRVNGEASHERVDTNERA